MRRQWLLHELHAILDEQIDHAQRALRGPRSVCVDAKNLRWCGTTYGADDLFVAVTPELDLENRILESLVDPLHELLLGLWNPDREAGERCFAWVETPKPIHRDVQSLADEIMRRCADRRLHRSIEPERGVHLGLEIFERERIVGEHSLGDRSQLLECGDRAVRRLAVEPIGRRLAPPFHPVAIDDAHANQLPLARATAGDDEWMLGVHGVDVVRDLHAANNSAFVS